MPLNLDTAHWSRPAGVRTLLALRRLGGSATTWQIAEQTKSVAAHTDVCHARCLCQADGICDGEVAIVRTYEGRSGSDRSIQRYTLHPLVHEALKSGWLQDELQYVGGPDGTPESPKPWRRRLAEQQQGGTSKAAPHRQAVLFRHHLPRYLREP